MQLLEHRRWILAWAVTSGLVLTHLGFRASGQLDLLVYRAGAQRLLDGVSLYDHPPGDLPFTYPPFAALLFAPLARLSSVAAEAVVPVLGCAALVLVLRRLGLRGPALWLAPLALLLEPFWSTLHFGQVNLVLMALVLLDLSRDRGRTHGVWAGVAAGTKLTPLVFAAFLVATGQWRALARFLAAFAATVAVPSLVAPGDVGRFWVEILPDSGRIGAPWYAANQSLMGALARVGGEAAWVRPAWFVLATGAVLACLWLARVLWAGEDRLAAVSCVGLASLLASPVSWSHHWVWTLPLSWVLLQRVGTVLAATWTSVFVLAPHLWMPRGDDLERTWTWQHLPGNAYVLFGLVWLALVATNLRRHTGGPHHLSEGAAPWTSSRRTPTATAPPRTPSRSG